MNFRVGGVHKHRRFVDVKFRVISMVFVKGGYGLDVNWLNLHSSKYISPDFIIVKDEQTPNYTELSYDR